jgi:hypothetical protein
MALILARSPYHISRGSFDGGAQLSVDIGTIDDGGVFTSLKTPPYSLSFRNETHLDISPFIRDYLIDNEVLVVRTTLSGTSGGNVIADVTEEYIATDGYTYYEDGSNKDFTELLRDTTSYYAGSNNIVYRNRSEPIRIPLLCPDEADVNHATNTTVTFYKDDLELQQDVVDFGYYDNGGVYTLATVNSSNGSTRVAYFQEDGIESFEERVLIDGGIYESSCNTEFDVAYTEHTPNRILITPKGDTSKSYELTIVPVRECNYTPHKLIFINKYGVEEDFWFFKKSVDNITTSRESFRANTLPNYLSGTTGERLSQHSYASYNLNGKKTMNMNTGFIPESFKENIRQLMLSEKVWIYLDGNKLPITIKNSDMVLKKAVNEKLINYEIEIEFAYDIINNIG